MGILDKKNLHLYPAFISLLCSRISESELLENSTNVNRLYLETVRALVHYLGAIKISLLRNDNSRESEEKLRVLISRLSPSTDSKWDSILEHGGRELMERLAFSTEDHGELRAKGILEIRKIISEFLYAEVDRNKSMAKLVADFRHEFHEPSLECATNLDLLAMLMAYADVVSKAKDRSMNRVERANEYLSKSLAYLLSELKSLFAFKLGSLESCFQRGKDYLGFFRIYYGQAFIPVLLPIGRECPIGSVFLFKEGKKNSYQEIVELSPLVIHKECSGSDCRGLGFSFYAGHTQTNAQFSNFHCGHDLQDRELYEWFKQYESSEPSDEPLTSSEKIYYEKLYEYWSSEVSDSQEEQALQVMFKVLNLSVDRLYLIEKLVKEKLGIENSQGLDARRNAYRKLFEDLTAGNFLEALERVTLQEQARVLGLGNAETLEMELQTWLTRAKALKESKAPEDTEDLIEVLVQVALIDFNNPIFEEIKASHGVDIYEDPRVSGRKKLFSDYLRYLKIVYEDEVVTPDERRFLETQRKRLKLTQKEGFELEYLEEKLVEVLDQEHDQTYLMQKENFKLGGILLAKALVSEDQLNHALEIQSREKGTKLGAVLYELGYVDPSELKRCLDLQEHLYLCKESHLFGSIALKFALIDKRQLNEALRSQELHFQEKEEHRSLGDILLSMGSISQQTLDFILSIQRLTTRS